MRDSLRPGLILSAPKSSHCRADGVNLPAIPTHLAWVGSLFCLGNLERFTRFPIASAEGPSQEKGIQPAHNPVRKAQEKRKTPTQHKPNKTRGAGSGTAVTVTIPAKLGSMKGQVAPELMDTAEFCPESPWPVPFPKETPKNGGNSKGSDEDNPEPSRTKKYRVDAAKLQLRLENENSSGDPEERESMDRVFEEPLKLPGTFPDALYSLRVTFPVVKESRLR